MTEASVKVNVLHQQPNSKFPVHSCWILLLLFCLRLKVKNSTGRPESNSSLIKKVNRDFESQITEWSSSLGSFLFHFLKNMPSILYVLQWTPCLWQICYRMFWIFLHFCCYPCKMINLFCTMYPQIKAKPMHFINHLTFQQCAVFWLCMTHCHIHLLACSSIKCNTLYDKWPI